MTFHEDNSAYIKQYKSEISRIKKNHKELLGDIDTLKGDIDDNFRKVETGIDTLKSEEKKS